MILCKCGFNNSETDSFCAQCGNQLQTASNQPPTISDASQANAGNGELTIGAIAYAAKTGSSYEIVRVVFTDKQVLGIAASKLTGRIGAGAGVVLWLAGMDPSTGFGLGGLLGMNAWKNFKKSIEGKPMVYYQKDGVTEDLLKMASFKLPYEKIKDVSIKKIALSSDYLLNLSAGFFGTEKLAIMASAVDEVKSLLQRTPLASKLKS